jgi:hypothetical protein
MRSLDSNEGTMRNLDKVSMAQNKTQAKTATAHHNTNSPQTQKTLFTSRATSFMSNRKSLNVTYFNSRGDGFGKGDHIRHNSSTSRVTK